MFGGFWIGLRFFGGKTAFIGLVLSSEGTIILCFSLSLSSMIRGHLYNCLVIFLV